MGSFIVSGNNPYDGTARARRKIRVNYTETVDQINNRSTIAITSVEMACEFGTQYIVDGYIKVNGTTAATLEGYSGQTSLVTVVSDESFRTISNVVTSPVQVAHEADGTGTAIFTFVPKHGYAVNPPENAGIYAYNNLGHSENNITFKNPELTVQLTQIPRASTLSVSNGTLGETQSLTVNKSSPSFRSAISYTCGSASGDIAYNAISTVIPFTPPISLAAQNTAGNTVTIEYTLTTKNGDVIVGQTTASATYTIPATVKPSVSSGWASIIPYNAGTAADGISAFVQGFSKAQAVFDASKISLAGDYGATIAGYRLLLNGLTVSESPYRTGLLATSGTMTATCTVIDSRGNSVSENITFTVYAYSAPTISNASVIRCDSSGNPSSQGTYISAAAKANISSVNGFNSYSLSARYKQRGGVWGSPIAMTSETPIVFGNGLISISHSYDVEIVLTDSFGSSATFTATVNTDVAAFNMNVQGNGAAIGKYSETPYALELPPGWMLKLNDTTLSEAQLQALLNLL